MESKEIDINMTKEVEIQKISKNLYRIPIPVPFPMKYVYCYLFHSEKKSVIIDAGFNNKEGRNAWRRVFKELAIDPSCVSSIFITHFHPDHFGLAGWLQQLTDAPVIMSEIEWKMAKTVWYEKRIQIDLVGRMMRNHGVSESFATEIMTHMEQLQKHVLPLPEVTSLATNNLNIEGENWEIFVVSGHCDGQLCFYNSEEKLMIIADQVLDKITPNISKWPNAAEDPLSLYLKSLEELKQYEVQRALPGHGKIVKNFLNRIDEIVNHHHRRLQKIKESLHRKVTAYEVACQIFNYEAFTPHQWRFAMAETIAHLEYLVNINEIEKKQGQGVIYYSK